MSAHLHLVWCLVSGVWCLLYCLSFARLQAIKKTYGEKSAKATQAFKALDASLAEFFDAMSVGSGRRLTSQFVVGPALAERLAVGGRRLGACPELVMILLREVMYLFLFLTCALVTFHFLGSWLCVFVFSVRP